MKVVYTKPILQKIDDAILQAARQGKDIEYIELNPKEVEQFDREIKRVGLLRYRVSAVPHEGEDIVGLYKGIRVKREETEF
jgi:hypothetical protein